MIHDVVSEIDVPIQRLQTLEQELFESIATRRFHMYLLESFAGAALLLALVGMYGWLAAVRRIRLQ